jgi:predicted nucleic acid-binding protein
VKLVVDASVSVKWFMWDVQTEPDADVANALLLAVTDGEHQLFQPPHWKAEVLSVLARHRPDKMADTVVRLDTLKRAGRNWLTLDLPDDTYKLACELSHRLNQHLFDALYHAAALKKVAQP